MQAMPIVMDEVTYYAPCHLCAARVSRRVFPVPSLHTAGNPGAGSRLLTY
jgi:hypothetical protein